MSEYGEGTNPENEIILAGGKLEYCSSITGEISAGTFVNIGYTAKEAGGTLRDPQPRFKDVFVTGLQDPVKRRALDRDVTFKATILQAKLENLAIAAGGSPADVVAGKFKGGYAKDATILKWRYTVQNDDNNSKDQRLTLFQAKVVDAFEIPWADDKESAVVVTLKPLAAPSTVKDGGSSLEGYRYLLEEGSF